MARTRSELIRSSKKFKRLVNLIQAKYIMAGKKPPTISKITELIAERINREDVLKNEIIRF